MIYLGDYLIEQKHFGDNALHLNIPEDKFNPWITWLYENDSEIFTIYCIRKHYPDKVMYLNMSYTPHARMDRVKNPEDVFTLKYFCEIINSLNFMEVHILDPHSNVCVDYLNNVIIDDVTLHIKNAIHIINSDEWTDVIPFYPDAGAMKRYQPMINNETVIYGQKHRNWETGRIEDYELCGDIDKIKNRDILIIDDICSYGGTFVRAAEALHKAGARNIYLYVTHCESNVHQGDVFKDDNIIAVYTTNSIYKSAHCDTDWRVVIV